MTIELLINRIAYLCVVQEVCVITVMSLSLCVCVCVCVDDRRTVGGLDLPALPAGGALCRAPLATLVISVD
jgi:hypothetical protein